MQHPRSLSARTRQDLLFAQVVAGGEVGGHRPVEVPGDHHHRVAEQEQLQRRPKDPQVVGQVHPVEVVGAQGLRRHRQRRRPEDGRDIASPLPRAEHQRDDREEPVARDEELQGWEGASRVDHQHHAGQHHRQQRPGMPFAVAADEQRDPGQHLAGDQQDDPGAVAGESARAWAEKVRVSVGKIRANDARPSTRSARLDESRAGASTDMRFPEG